MSEGTAPPRRPVQAKRPFAELQTALGGLGEVRAPGDAEEPILPPPVRAWLHGWLTEIRSGAELAAVGLKARTTAVLHGPPGCGKTTLAHHLAARLGLPLVIVGPETVGGMYVGEPEKKMGELFRVLAASTVPYILFLDELDSIGGKRGGFGNIGKTHDVVLTILLRKIEECRSYVIGATNRADSLDPALWRRFHTHLAILLPGVDERFAIMRRYGLPYAFRDEDLDLLVDLTDGASPALLRMLMEGIKRALVLAPKLGRDISEPRAVFASVITSAMPPPDAVAPPLWQAGGLDDLVHLAWPPSLAPAS